MEDVIKTMTRSTWGAKWKKGAVIVMVVVVDVVLVVVVVVVVVCCRYYFFRVETRCHSSNDVMQQVNSLE